MTIEELNQIQIEERAGRVPQCVYNEIGWILFSKGQDMLIDMMSKKYDEDYASKFKDKLYCFKFIWSEMDKDNSIIFSDLICEKYNVKEMKTVSQEQRLHMIASMATGIFYTLRASEE